VRNSSTRPSAAEEVAEKVKNAVIPRSETTRNLSFCEHLNQEGSLASLGMTAFVLFPQPATPYLFCGTCGIGEVMPCQNVLVITRAWVEIKVFAMLLRRAYNAEFSIARAMERFPGARN
jgi:hypothetical protein